MKVIGISGSPKISGFTNALLGKALEGANASGANTEKIILNELEFDPCQECRECASTGDCALSDDMSPLYEKILSTDGLIVASPIYFGTVSAQLKMMIDRLGCIWVAKYRLKEKTAISGSRKGVFLCVAGEDREEYFESARKVVKNMFATIDVEYTGELFAGGMDKYSPDSLERKKFLEKAFKLGESMGGHR